MQWKHKVEHYQSLLTKQKKRLWLDQHQLQIKKIKSEMLLGNGHGVKKKKTNHDTYESPVDS